MSSGVKGAIRVSIPSSVKEMIDNIKDITGQNHTEDEIYAVLKECSMDPNETLQKLLLLDTFHEVKRKRDRRKENLNKEPTELRWKPGTQHSSQRRASGEERPWTASVSPFHRLAQGVRVDMDVARQKKVQKYEEFVDQRLKPDLVHAIAERDKVFEQQKIFSDLKRNIQNLEKNNVTNLRTLVNLGSEVYMQADVPDTSHIFVDVGLGFHVEFTRSEALNFTATKEEQISWKIDEYTRLIASIKAQIKMVCEGIREILASSEL